METEIERKNFTGFSPIADNLSEYLGVYPDESPFFKAILKFGADMQKLICIEEMAELTKEIVKCRRDATDASEQLISEFVDCCICLAQLEIIIRCSESGGIDKIRACFDEKIGRLNRLIEE